MEDKVIKILKTYRGEALKSPGLSLDHITLMLST